MWLGRNLWWTNNDNNYKPFVPSEQECSRDFKEGITRQVDLMKVRGEPTRVGMLGDVVMFYYRTNSNHDVGCAMILIKMASFILFAYPGHLW